MPGDYTRIAPNLRGLPLMQQGRVLVDADWNELVRTSDRRLRAETIDTIGRAVYPSALTTSFAVGYLATPAPGVFTLGSGRYYVDGLLAENRAENGATPPVFDAELDEMTGTGPITLEQQPYWVPTLKTSFSQGEKGPFLVVLDVWHREVSVHEDPKLVDPAVGVDTSTRLETAWQVYLLPVGGPVDCSTPADKIPEWGALTSPSGARLTTGAVGAVTTDDPCAVSLTGGYRGVENRLYRVEIHSGANMSDATFKWSRDNASVAATVTSLTATTLNVTSTGRDSYLKFKAGDTIEVTCDERELAGLAGDLSRVAGVDDANGIITLDGAFPLGLIAGTHLRVRRWDSPLPLAVVSASPVVLEDGVQVSFSLATTSPSTFHVGDHWSFAARTADGSVEALSAAPPLGVHHHYARLGTVASPGATPTDCRIPWPPRQVASEGKDCACTVCVSADDHNSGVHTIGDAIHEIVKAGGGTICLEVGTYHLKEPLVFTSDGNYRVRGQGSATLLVYDSPESKSPAISISEARAVSLADFALSALGSVGINVGSRATIEMSGIAVDAATGLVMFGDLPKTTLRGCTFHAFRDNAIVVGKNGDDAPVSSLGSFHVTGSTFDAADTAILVQPRTTMRDMFVIEDNVFMPSKLMKAGVVVQGMRSSAVARIRRNRFSRARNAIFVGALFSEVSDNLIEGSTGTSGLFAGPPPPPAAAITLSGTAGQTEGHTVVRGNTMIECDAGVLFVSFAPSRLVKVEENTFTQVVLCISTFKDATVPMLAIVRNAFLDGNGTGAVVLLSGAAFVDIGENLVESVARSSEAVDAAFGVHIQDTTAVRIHGNHFMVDPPVKTSTQVVRVDGATERIEVTDNLFRADVGTTKWTAVFIDNPTQFDRGLEIIKAVEDKTKLDEEMVVAFGKSLVADPKAFMALAGNAEKEAGTNAGISLPRFFTTRVRVTGNEIRRGQIDEAIHIGGGTSAIVSDNRCEAVDVHTALVSIASVSNAVVNGNELLVTNKTPATSPALLLSLSTKANAAVTGNIIAGGVTPPLAPAFAAVNVVT